MASTVEQLRGLVLSATELRAMTNWPSALIEDYLSLIENILVLAEFLDVEIAQKLEEVPTDFNDGSVPFVASNVVIDDNDDFNFNNTTKYLLIGGGIKGPNRAKQFFFAGM